jgi:hypothetical protein
MAKRCPSCGQQNRDAALFCEFCKGLFNKVGAPGLRAPPKASWAGSRFGVMGLVAVVSGGIGFWARGLIRTERVPPAVVVETAPQRSPPSDEPEPVAPPQPVMAAPAMPPPRTRIEPTLPVVAAVPAPPTPPTIVPAVVAPTPAVAAVRKHFTIPYRASEGAAQRIIIPVTFNDRTTASMALDTGAPGTFIFSPLAARIGVLHEGDSRLVTAAAGIGGKAAAALVILDSISVAEARNEFVVATVTNPMSSAFEGLVGMDFLAGYAVEIDTQQHRLLLTERPTSGEAPAGHDEAWWRRTFGQLESQRTTWKQIEATAKERAAHSEVSAGREADELNRLVTYAESQSREAERLTDRLERYASSNAVPLEWRR